MELYVFDRDLNLKGLFEGYFSLRWTRRYYRCGEFELHCGVTAETLDLFKKDNIIYKDEEAGYIEYKHLKTEENGQETLIVKGKMLIGYLGRRIIASEEIINDTAEIAMRTLVDNNCINTDAERIIDNLTLGDLKNFDYTVNYEVRYKNLLEEIEKLSKLSNIGFLIKLDRPNKKLKFETYRGLDRTAGQTINPRAIFSREFENVLTQEYMESINNYRNVAIIRGEDLTAQVGEETGLDRYEVFSEQNLNKGDLSDSDYIDLLKEKGNLLLASTKEIQTFDSKINLKSNLEYKTDFDLGDTVTFNTKKWGISIDTQITEIEEVYEKNGLSLNLTFGDTIPTLIEKIKQER